MIGFKIPKVTFRVRTGDEEPADGGCAIGGAWSNVTTDDYFANKRVVLFFFTRCIYTNLFITTITEAFEKLVLKLNY